MKKGNLQDKSLEFSKANWILLIIATIVIIAGYVVMQHCGSQYGDITISVVMLFIGYIVLVPLAIMYKSKKNRS